MVWLLMAVPGVVTPALSARLQDGTLVHSSGPTIEVTRKGRPAGFVSLDDFLAGRIAEHKTHPKDKTLNELAYLGRHPGSLVPYSLQIVPTKGAQALVIIAYCAAFWSQPRDTLHELAVLDCTGAPRLKLVRSIGVTEERTPAQPRLFWSHGKLLLRGQGFDFLDLHGRVKGHLACRDSESMLGRNRKGELVLDPTASGQGLPAVRFFNVESLKSRVVRIPFTKGTNIQQEASMPTPDRIRVRIEANVTFSKGSRAFLWTFDANSGRILTGPIELSPG